jgi:hypothetical protein
MLSEFEDDEGFVLTEVRGFDERMFKLPHFDI